MPFDFKTFTKDFLFLCIITLLMFGACFPVLMAVAMGESFSPGPETHFISKRALVLLLLSIIFIVIFSVFFVFRSIFKLKGTIIQAIITGIGSLGLTFGCMYFLKKIQFPDSTNLAFMFILYLLSFVNLKHLSDSILLKYNAEMRAKKEG